MKRLIKQSINTTNNNFMKTVHYFTETEAIESLATLNGVPAQEIQIQFKVEQISDITLKDYLAAIQRLPLPDDEQGKHFAEEWERMKQDYIRSFSEYV